MPEAIYTIRLENKISTPLAGLESQMNQLERSLVSIQLTLQKGFSGGFKKMASDGDSAAKKIKSSFKETEGSLNSFKAVLGGTFFGGALLSGFNTVVAQLKQLPIDAINASREFTNMRDAISFASGRGADKNLKFLDDTIDRLGLDMISTTKGFKTFQGGLMGTSLEGRKGLDIFEAVSEASSVMKLSADQTEGTFLALGQMISKGTVQAEELRGQLGERLPGAFNIFARALGVSTSKLGDMLKKGEVISEDALPKFARELKKIFSPGVLKAQDSFNANMNRFNNFIYESKISLGDALIPSLNEFVKIIPRLDFSPILMSFNALTGEISLLTNQLNELIALTGTSFTKFEILTIGIRYVTYSFTAAYTPIRAIIQIYSQLINLIRTSFPIFQGLGNIFSGIFSRDWSKMSLGVEQLKDGFKSLAKTSSELASEYMHNERQAWSKIFAPINDPTKAGSGFANGTGTGGKTSASQSSAGKEAGVEKIRSASKNVTINVGKLIGEIKFEKYDQQNEAKMMDFVKRALLTALNDVNIQPQ